MTHLEDNGMPNLFTLKLPLAFFKDVIYLFLEKVEGREKERERHINVWLPLAHPQPGTWPATQTCSLSWNPTCDTLVLRPVLDPHQPGPISILEHLLK